MISNLAYVHPDAKIGKNVTIEPFAYIEGDVVIGDDCWIGPHAIIYNGARLGKGNKVHPGACIACLPQDLKFALRSPMAGHAAQAVTLSRWITKGASTQILSLGVSSHQSGTTSFFAFAETTLSGMPWQEILPNM